MSVLRAGAVRNVTAMEKLAKKNVMKVIDLLCERLAFERSGVKLYDTLLSRLRASDDPALKALLGDVKEFREEEKEHEEWLEEQIRALGGDAHAPTEQSVLVQTEAEGLERVIRRDPSIPHDFHALLTAELADNAGWDLLVQLADELGDSDAKKQFEKRLREEEKHLSFVRRTLLELTRNDVSVPPPSVPAD
jgi:rubrerythrin